MFSQVGVLFLFMAVTVSFGNEETANKVGDQFRKKGWDVGSNIKYPLNPRMFAELKDYFESCDEYFDFDSFGSLSCRDIREVNRVYLNHEGKFEYGPRRIEQGPCLNPDGAGITFENRSHCSSGRVRTGIYRNQNPNHELVLACDSGDIHSPSEKNRANLIYAASAILYDKKTRFSCFIKIGKVEVNDSFALDVDKHYFRPLWRYLSEEPSYATCVYCHTPHLYTKPPAYADTEILKLLKKNGHQLVNKGGIQDQSQYLPSQIALKNKSDSYRLLPKSKELLEKMTKRELANRGITPDRRHSWDMQLFKVKKGSLLQKKCSSCHLLPATRYGARLALTMYGLCENSDELRSCRGLDYRSYCGQMSENFHDLMFGTSNGSVSESLKGELYDYAKACILPENRKAYCKTID